MTTLAAKASEQPTRITAVDLFCGAGGLSFGLQKAGISVVAGIDVDPACEFPFESNVEAAFLEKDVREVTGDHLAGLWGSGALRLLAGCAPCQPFSPYRRGVDTSDEEHWPLLAEFGRLVAETTPELVTMENVPRVGGSSVYLEFVEQLQSLGYHVDARSCYGPAYGLPQQRRRLVLLASQLGPISVPAGHVQEEQYRTVRQTIGKLPAVASGRSDSRDRLHRSRALSRVNLDRIRASTPGGTWEEWPANLRAPCHRKKSGSSFRNVYARMEWDEPSPTITTLAHNYGAGRFGHPEQDRPITLREAAMLQGFPRNYRFVRPRDPIWFNHLGRLIGNAVPPPLAKAIGYAFAKHVSAYPTGAAFT
jgi:DNA (cytosine-5)-methyltransferase 1